jgi:hypothetical protein
MHTSRSAFAKVMSVLHGDKYMEGAYPPAWRDPASPIRQDEVGRAAAAGDVAPSAPPKVR